VRAFASGSMSVSDSNDGAAIFHIANIGPGMTGEGEVTISNTGAAPGALTLAAFDRSDAPGLYGGALSTRLELRVADVTAADATVYAGGLISMPELQLGTLAAGSARTYRFSVGMRDGGPPSSPYLDDNLYQRAGTSLGYDWVLSEVEASGDADPPEASPTAPEAPAPAAPGPRLPIPVDSRSLVGDARPNSLAGTPGDDRIYGLGAADTIVGRRGDDYILGGAGADRLYGGPGADRLRGGVGADRIYGGSGPDVVFARDGEADVADCGPGADVAFVDQYDRAKNCEGLHLRYARLFVAEKPR